MTGFDRFDLYRGIERGSLGITLYRRHRDEAADAETAASPDRRGA